MSGIYYGAMSFAVLLVVRWCFASEFGRKPGIAGIFAMRDRKIVDDEKNDDQTSRFRRKKGQ